MGLKKFVRETAITAGMTAAMVWATAFGPETGKADAAYPYGYNGYNRSFYSQPYNYGNRYPYNQYPLRPYPYNYGYNQPCASCRPQTRVVQVPVPVQVPAARPVTPAQAPCKSCESAKKTTINIQSTNVNVNTGGKSTLSPADRARIRASIMNDPRLQ